MIALVVEVRHKAFQVWEIMPRVVIVIPLGQPLQVVFPPVVSTLVLETASLNGVAGSEHASEVSDSTGPTTGSASVVSRENKGLLQVVTELVQRQTAMIDAQTRAMSAQGLPPMPYYSGEGIQSSEEGFDKWIEQFEERAKLAGWSEDHKRYVA